MVKIKLYKDKCKELWNQFINDSKNGVFLFNRDYMEYHADRFDDYSLMFFDNDKLIAVMPANIKEDTVFSHGGLTFGGVIFNNMKVYKMLEIFDLLKEFLKDTGINKLIYKAVPHIYHTIPAQEDLYALFRNDAKLIRRDISSAIFRDEKLKYSEGKRGSISKGKRMGLKVKRDHDFKSFMAIKEDDLKKKYGLVPVHTADEIELLAEKFPENIKLFTVGKESNDMIAGGIIYESDNVAHGQYLTSTDEGRRLNAPDFLIDFLINDYYKDKKYFDFGISTENNGLYLNKNLIRSKEGLGGRGITYDFYELEI